MGSPPLIAPGQPAAMKAGEFQGAGASSMIRFLTSGVQPPSRVYLGVDDQLIVSLVSNTANITLQCNSRLLRTDNVIVPLTQTIKSTTAGTLVTSTFPMAEGFLLSLMPILSAALSAGQWAYCTVGLRRGQGTLIGTYEVLYAGYVGGTFTRGYPEALLVMPNEGNGTTMVKVVTPPANGAQWTVTVPAYANWRINAGEAHLVCSAQVANRILAVGYDDGTHAYYGCTGVTNVPANNTMYIEFGLTGQNGQSGTDFSLWAPIPPNMIMGPGHRIISEIVNIQTNDSWDYINFMVTEWLAVL